MFLIGKKIKSILCVTVVLFVALGMTAPVLAQTQNETPQEPEKLEKPTLRVKSAKSNQVTLAWKSVKNADKYFIYQKKGKGKWKKIKTLSSSKKKFTKKKLKLKKTYSYKIKAKVGDEHTEFSSVVKKIKVKGKYTQPSMYGGKLTKKELKKVRDKVANFVNKNQTWKLDQAEKADLAAQYIASTITYSDWQNSKYYNTAYGGLIKKKGACSAYMRAYKALADGMGIKCKCIHTKVSSSGHQWCHVKVDGTWYILETQLGMWLGEVKKSKKSSNIYEYYYVMKK